MSNMVCPKCGKFQPKAELCESCGIAIEKFKLKSNEQPVRVQKVTKQSNEVNKVQVVLGIAFIFIVLIYFPEVLNGGNSAVAYKDLPVLEKQRKGKGIKQYEFMRMFEANEPFSSLAKENYYTVIEGYKNSCSICKRMEARFPDFLKARKDVLIRRVHFPERGMNFSFNGGSREEIEKQAEEMNQKIQSYNFCGTPHIEIYDQNKQLIVADTCRTRPGTNFLRQWMSAES